MRRQLHDFVLMIAPVAVTVVVSLGSPWLHAQGTHAASARAADRDGRTLAMACEASHRAQAAPRAQSPQWQREQRAAVEQCLRDGLRVIRTARAAQ